MRRLDDDRPAQHRLTRRIDLAVEQHATILGGFLAHRHGRAHQVAHADDAVELQLLRDDPRPRPGQPALEHAGNDGFRCHRLHAQVAGLDRHAFHDVERHDIARDQQQRLDLVLANHAFGARGRADLDLVKGNVAVAAHCDRSIHVVLSSVYLSNACSDLSRPVPDCLKPPNGTVMSSAS